MLTSLPNLLTLSRIAAIPVLVILFFFDGALMRWLAFLVYAFACITDFFDGYFARHWGQVSALGRFLDPIADKLLVAALIVLLVAFDHVTGFVVVPALVILCREILVSGLREYLAEIKVPMPVSRLAKWKTGIQMVALGILIVGNAGPNGLPIQLIGEIGIWIAAGLTFVTGYDYLARGLKHMTAKAPAGR
ncbi:MAG: CDP-diacylglycerol--glycerol-3-phosphate 3-phosphatidyltransferase [Kiloniellales bacterium]